MIDRAAYFALVLSVLVCFLATGLAQQATPTEVASSLPVRHFVAPEYPVEAWLAGVQGTAVTELLIKPDGTVDSAKFVSGYPIFRKSLETALAKWTFRVDEATKLNVSARFILDGGCSTPTDKRSRVEAQVSADLPSNLEIRACLPVIETSVDQTHHR